MILKRTLQAVLSATLSLVGWSLPQSMLTPGHAQVYLPEPISVFLGNFDEPLKSVESSPSVAKNIAKNVAKKESSSTGNQLIARRVIQEIRAPLDLKGWDHLYHRLLKEGVPAEKLQSVLSDKRMPKRETLYFSISPKESKYLYRRVNTPRSRQNALRFGQKHVDSLKKAQTRFGVPAEVILSVLQVETYCGAYTGRSRVLPQLARLAAAAQPENVLENIKRRGSKPDSAHAEKIKARALWLESEFLPHTAAAFTIASRTGVHPLELRGSPAGAIGLPQFLPANIERYGIDGNGDGKVDIFQAEDAVHSVANYLNKHGWNGRKTMSLADKRKAVWHYNRSDEYVSTVLQMASSLKPKVASLLK